MNSWFAFTALLPILVVISCILFLKKNAVFSSLAGLMATGLIITFIDSYQITSFQLIEIVRSALILSISAIIVIIPGLYLNGIIREQKRIDQMTSWIEKLPISPENKALILLVGFLPAVESLTGFGVSLFLGVPIFIKLFPKRIALKLSLLGMNIMPWGTLALATIIGASLIQQPVVKLGSMTSLTSFFIFPYISLVSVFIIGGVKAVREHIIIAFFLGILFSILLFINNYYIYPETAGVLAGIITGLLGIYLSYHGKSYVTMLLKGNPIRAFLPYVLVLILTICIRIFPPINGFLTNALVLRSGNVSFSIFTSPGIILIMVAFFMYKLNPVQVSLAEALKKSKYACLSITAFLFLSQAMLESGMIETLSTALLSFTGKSSALLLSPLIGMTSGFTTGSNVGGNALLIKAQEEIGQQWGHDLLFAAVHNSGAGHMVFSSIPVVVLVQTIVKDTSLVNYTPINESYLLNFTLKVSIGIYLTILLSLLILFRIDAENLLF